MKELLIDIDREIEKRNITEQKIAEILQSNKDITNRRIIGGYSSVAIVDREGQKIPISALKSAAAKFMSNIFARPAMVFHCLVPETKILTFQHGYSKYEEIQNLEIGMKIFTHTGKPQRILNVITHEVDMDIFEIKLSNGETIKATGEHPILTRDRGFAKASELTTEDVLLHIETAFSKGGKLASKRRWDRDKGKQYNEIFGKQRAEEIKTLISQNRIGKGIGERIFYTVTENHNSNDRRGKPWIEVYGHSKPNYGGQMGDKNTNWKGGISALPYSFDFTAKKDKIRLRDDFRCQLCNKKESLEINEYSRKLSIHHIDYDKQNSNDLNLITLCDDCNSKVNFNREIWKNYFQKMQMERMTLENGIVIKTIKPVHYVGKVYNLEIENDKTYSGKGIIFHNSDVQVGRVIPKWTNPETGETLETKVDDLGWYTLVEIRDDIEIANKTWEEVLKGNIRSFSIAGSSKDKLQKQEHGVGYEQVNELEIYETTLCFVPETKVWTKEGLKEIKNIKIGDFVFTHLGRWKKVINTMSRTINEEITKIITEQGTLEATNEHPIRTLLYGGAFKGTHYDWKNISDIKVNDLISSHISKKNCKVCNTPLFSGSHLVGTKEDFCSLDCRYKKPNRKGTHYISKLRGITKKENPNLSGGFKTPEGKIKQQLAHQTPKFRKKRKEIQLKLWQNQDYAKLQMKKIHTSPNNEEIELTKCLEVLYPGEWKFVGNGEVFLGGKNPDFININGQKKIIEYNGTFWHKNDNPKDRIKHFQKYGYETLIVTDFEYKKDKEKCLEKIKEFCGNKLIKVIKTEKINYSGLVYNLEVEDDNSYTTEIAVVHNCEVPVCQEAKFNVLWNPNRVLAF